MRLRIAKTLGRPFAEFVTIVTGVLLALTVDSCVERQNERELEQSYLSRLEQELRQDSMRIEEGLMLLARADSALVQLARLRTRPEQPADAHELVRGLIRARVRGLPGSLSQSTFDDLRSTGAIRLIRDDRIRIGLANHYAGIARQRQILETDYTHYPLALSELLPGELQYQGNSRARIPDELVDESIKQLIRAPDLDRHINSKRGYAALQRNALESTLASGDTLLAMFRND